MIAGLMPINKQTVCIKSHAQMPKLWRMPSFDGMSKGGNLYTQCTNFRLETSHSFGIARGNLIHT